MHTWIQWRLDWPAPTMPKLLPRTAGSPLPGPQFLGASSRSKLRPVSLEASGCRVSVSALFGMEDPILDDELPPYARLVSLDQREFDTAWEAAFIVLWRRGMSRAWSRMSGHDLEADRKDVVQTAILQFQRRLVQGDAPGSEADGGITGEVS